MSEMRAKMVIGSVNRLNETTEELSMRAVCKNEPYADDGLDENNTFSSFTPSAELSITISNPALVGKFKEGESYYLDFTKAPE